MRGHLVEQIKIIHFGGGQVKWGLLCGIQLWGISSNQMKPFKFMVFSRVAIVSSWSILLLLQNARLFYIMSREEPGIRRITIYMCRSGKYNTLCWSTLRLIVIFGLPGSMQSNLPQTTSLVTLSHITRGDFSMMFRTPLSRIPINDLDSKASVQIIIFDILRCRSVCERSMPQSDGLCRSTKPLCILSTFSDPGP